MCVERTQIAVQLPFFIADTNFYVWAKISIMLYNILQEYQQWISSTLLSRIELVRKLRGKSWRKLLTAEWPANESKHYYFQSSGATDM